MGAFHGVIAQMTLQPGQSTGGPDNRHGQVRFLCRCECGAERIVTSFSLRNGGSNGCRGCAGVARIAMEGRRYGDLVVTRRVASYRAPSGVVLPRVEARCDCGRTHVANAHAVRQGTVRRCPRCSADRRLKGKRGVCRSCGARKRDGKAWPSGCRTECAACQRMATRNGRCACGAAVSKRRGCRRGCK